VLLANLDGEPLGEPRLLRFTTGARKQAWNRNVVALGLAGGFLEPLESTSIYMIQSGIARLLEMFPQRDFSPVLIERYNARARFEYERIRDFLILHYHATERDDTPFWNYCRTMPVPEQLDEYIRLFRDSGRFFRDGEEMFATPSWVQVMLGQRIMPRSYHPLVDQMPEKDLAGFMASVSQVVNACVEAMPMHQAFIDKVCPAPAMATA
jgi:tryptophan halogenase